MEASSGSAGLLSLPTEVIVCCICPYLSFSDIAALQRTCKRLLTQLLHEQVWKQQLLSECNGSFKEAVRWMVQTKQHVLELTRELDREVCARSTWEKMQMRLVSEYTEQRALNEQLMAKMKLLEEDNAWFMGGHKDKVQLESDLRRALQDVDAYQRRCQVLKEEVESKDRELKHAERRRSTAESEMKSETEDLKQTKRELLKSNAHLRAELHRLKQQLYQPSVSVAASSSSTPSPSTSSTATSSFLPNREILRLGITLQNKF